MTPTLNVEEVQTLIGRLYLDLYMLNKEIERLRGLLKLDEASKEG